MIDVDFFKNKKIFITGHTGFKGTWLSKVLIYLGAIVKGYSLEPENSLFAKINIENEMISVYGDIRDYEKLKKEFDAFSPEIVIHLAAQPIVLKSYEMPRYTYETNIMGTTNILECLRNSDSVKSFLNVTTDKVYENIEDKNYAYTECDRLNGHDPYSNSKSCSELITETYKQSYFENRDISISTARAGNVIGGGDYAENRIIPDCVRAAKSNEEIIVRNPNSIRSFQYILDVLDAYLLIVQKQYENRNLAGNYNVASIEKDIYKTGELVNIFCEKWGNISWKTIKKDGPRENNYLKIDAKKINEKLGWNPKLDINQAIDKVVKFEKSNQIEEVMQMQIEEYFGDI